MVSWPKVICILEWIFTCLALLGLIGFLLYTGLNIDALAEAISKINPDFSIEEIKAGLQLTMIIVGVVSGCLILIELVLNIVLTKGVYQRYHKYLQVWYIIQTILLGFAFIGMIVSIVSVVRGTESWYTLIGYAVSILYRVWTIKVIRTFIIKVKKDVAHGIVYQSPSTPY